MSRVVLVLSALFLFVLIACESPDPAPAIPLPTATASSATPKYVPSGQFVYRNLTPTAVPTPFRVPPPASVGEGLGVSFREFKMAFPLDYRPGSLGDWDFWAADNGEWFWVELEGHAQDLTVARITMNLIDPATRLPINQAAEFLAVFVSVVLPDRGDAIDWVDANLEKVVDDSIASRHRIGVAETRYGRRLVILQVHVEQLMLMVEAAH